MAREERIPKYELSFKKLKTDPDKLTNIELAEVREYQRIMADKMIREFKKAFFEKVGIAPEVWYKMTELPRKHFPVKQVRDIVEKIAAQDGLNPIMVTAYNREREYLYYRYCFAMIAHTYSSVTSLKELGNSFRKPRDHSTVIHNLQIGSDWIQEEPIIQNIYERILTELEILYAKEISAKCETLQINTQPDLSDVVL
jgi:hypothetical protein